MAWEDIIGATSTQTLTNKTLTAPDINGGTVDAITSLTVANAVDIGNYNLTALSGTFDSLTSGRVPFVSTGGLLIDDGDFLFATDTLTVTKIGAFQAAGAINFDSQNMTNVDIDSGTIGGVTLDGSIAGGDQAFTGVGDMTFTAGSILATGATEGNTLLVKAGGLTGATFITLTANDTLDVCELDACTLDAAIAKGTWTASGTWTLPALTAGGLVTSTSTTGYKTTATFVPDSGRTHYAFSIGNRAAELTVNLANAASQNLELFQMNVNLTASGGAPTSTSAVRLIRVRSTHDTVDMPNLRLMNINTYMDVQKSLQDAYGQMNGIDFYTNAITIGGEAAVAAFNIDADSAVTGKVRGVIINVYGGGLPASTSIGLEVRTDGGTATLGEGIRVWSVGGNSINYGLYIDGTINTADIRFSGGTTLVDDGTSLTLAGANLVGNLGAVTLQGTVTLNGQVFDAGSGYLEIVTTGSSALKLGDMRGLYFGIGNDARLIYGTTDADANLLGLFLHHTANNPPVFLIADVDLQGADFGNYIGDFSAISNPTVIIADDDYDSWIAIGHLGDDRPALWVGNQGSLIELLDTQGFATGIAADDYFILSAYDSTGGTRTGMEIMRVANNTTTPGKMSFYGATPVVRQASEADPTDLNTCIAAISSLIDKLEAYGLLVAA